MDICFIGLAGWYSCNLCSNSKTKTTRARLRKRGRASQIPLSDNPKWQQWGWSGMKGLALRLWHIFHYNHVHVTDDTHAEVEGWGKIFASKRGELCTPQIVQ